MQNALQITFRDMPASEALETRIRQKAEKLEKFKSRITSCRVTVEEAHRHHNQGRHFGVRIEVHVPHGEPVMATSSMTRTSTWPCAMPSTPSSASSRSGRSRRAARSRCTRRRHANSSPARAPR